MRLERRREGARREYALGPRGSKAELGEEAKEQKAEKAQVKGFVPRKRYSGPMSVGWAPTA